MLVQVMNTLGMKHVQDNVWNCLLLILVAVNLTIGLEQENHHK